MHDQREYEEEEKKTGKGKMVEDEGKLVIRKKQVKDDKGQTDGSIEKKENKD